MRSRARLRATLNRCWKTWEVSAPSPGLDTMLTNMMSRSLPWKRCRVTASDLVTMERLLTDPFKELLLNEMRLLRPDQ